MTDETATEPETYGPAKPGVPQPNIGRRFRGDVKQYRPNGSPVTRKVSKSERRLRRANSMKASTRPVDVRLQNEREMVDEAARLANNSHEARRYRDKDRAERRLAREMEAARAAEERRQLLLMKMAQNVASPTTPSPDSSPASLSSEPSPSTTSST